MSDTKRTWGNKPWPYDPEIGDAILAQLAEGLTLTRICAEPDMPTLTTVYKWMRLTPSFAQGYVRAKQEQADVFVDQMLDIADGKEPQDDLSELDEEARKRIEHARIQRDKLRVDTRRWVASKLKAHVYGDRVALAGDAEAPVVVKNIGDSDRKILERFVQNYSNRVDKPQEEENYDDLV